MEIIINVHIERLPEGVYLATSNDLQGLVAQGRTVHETLEIARDVARRLLEAQNARADTAHSFPLVGEKLDYPLIVAN